MRLKAWGALAPIVIVAGCASVPGPQDTQTTPTDAYQHSPFAVTAGRERVAAPSPGPRVAVIPVAGQSLAGNHAGAPYTPRHPNCLQINIADGQVYRLADPVLGATGRDGSYIGKLCDYLIDRGAFSHVIMVPVAVGGTKIVEWGPRGRHAPRLTAAITAAAQHGYKPTAIVWDQGNQDASEGTSRAAWRAGFRDVVKIGDQAGYSGPWLVTMQTMQTSGKPSPDIRAAQAEVRDGRRILFGGDIDALTGEYRQKDRVHLSDAGTTKVAEVIGAEMMKRVAGSGAVAAAPSPQTSPR